MFDLKLTDVFSTLCIGILSLALITYFYFIFNKFFVKDKFNQADFINWVKNMLTEDNAHSGYMVLALVTVYCLGVIAGDLTGRMTDSDSSHKNYILRELKWASQMRSQEENRKEAIVDSAKRWELTSLGNAVFRSKSIVSNANYITGTNFFTKKPTQNRIRQSTMLQDTAYNFNSDWTHIQNILRKDTAKLTRKMFGQFIQQIYYTGKNWCFSKDHEPLNELKSIQNRIDISRSVVLLLTFSIQLLALTVITNLISLAYLKIQNKEREGKFWWKPKFGKICHVLQIGFFAAFLVILVVSEECYEINQDNYNKRAFGYYVTEVNRVEYLKTLETDVVPIKKP